MIRNGSTASKSKVEIRGCIDLGSSYFRMLVVRERHEAADGGSGADHRELEVISEDRRYVGWGRDLEERGEITPSGAARACEALVALVAGAVRAGCAAPVLAATNVLRRARNAGEVAAELAEAASLSVQVLSERGEAALGFHGACSGLPEGSRVLLLDPGGTSTEIAWGVKGSLTGSMSVPWGTHRLYSMLGRYPPATAGIRRTMLRLDRGGFLLITGGASSLPAQVRDYTILATGGTAVSLAVIKRFMLRKMPRFRELEELTAGDLEVAGRRIPTLLEGGGERLLPLEQPRIRLIMPGLVLLRALLGELGVTRVRVTSRDLRWGTVMACGVPDAVYRFGRP